MRAVSSSLIIFAAAMSLHDIAACAADVTTSWVRKDPRAPFGFATNDPYLDRVKDMTKDQLTPLHEAGEQRNQNGSRG